MKALALALLPLAGCTVWYKLTDRQDTGDPGFETGDPNDDSAGGDDSSGGDDSNGGGDDSGQGTVVLDVDCEDGAYSDAPPAGPACLSGALRCGDTVYGTTAGGDRLMSEDLYGASFCFVAFEDYDGPERVYALEVPENTRATVRFDTSCTPLGHAVMRWDDEGRCPYGDQFLISECEGEPVGRGGVEVLDVFNAARYLVVVDGPDGTTGNFGIQVDCEPF